ncbi:hypothetical protein LY90DRAFT_508211 [Neocallimastix californiae]|uniref:Uncharacterized protein n=1 Tax=Neocallimastix californiae TaxID=1754190 RepID=A0A1Y2CYW3_9FUNG|nr:hypothetical protein LY90DRAFT_508211 [Neocallimastix californiae]|eukprot:ORY52232.1 hypothetical protein LY90DRAFT_508211 [Neocallimastix californiae]
MPNNNFNQGDEWQVQVSKRKKNNQRKQKKNQKYSSKEQLINKNKRDNSYYYQTSKKAKEQNGNRNKNGKRSNKFENKMKKQNRGRDNILDSISIERNKNLNVVKSKSLLKIQFERQQNDEKKSSIDINSKELVVPKKTISEMSDATAVSVTSLASDSNSMTSSTLTQTNSLKDQIDDNKNTEIIDKKDGSKEKLSETTLLNKENDEKEQMESSSKITSISISVSQKSSSSITINTVNTNGIISQMKKNSVVLEQKDEIIRRLESHCSLSSSSVTSFDSDESSKSEDNSGDDNESVITAKNDGDYLKLTEIKKASESKKCNEKINEKEIKKEEKNDKDSKKEDMTKKVLEFNFKNYTDVKPFIPKHLKVQQEQSKIEITTPKAQVVKHHNHPKAITEKKQYENENISGRKSKEINKIIRIDPSCLHQKDGHIVTIPSYVMNMKNGKNNVSNAQEVLQRNIKQKTNELQESKKKKFEELRKYLDNNGNNDDSSQGYQSLPICENESSNAAKKTEEKVVERPQVRKTMSNSTLEVSSTLKDKEHQRTSSYTMINIEYRNECVCDSICQLDVSNRIENEYNNVKCYNDPMEQSLSRVKPTSIKKSRSIQNITTTLSRKGSNHQLLLGSGGCMTVTHTITTCNLAPRLRTSKSFSWLKGTRTGLENTHITTVSTTTTTSHTNTLYTNLIGSKSYYPIVVLPTASVQQLSVETTSRKLRNSSSLPNMMKEIEDNNFKLDLF